MKTLTLTRNKGIAFIDDEDYESVSKHNWSLSISNKTHRYVKARIKGRGVYLHSFLIPDAELVDHKDNNGLNNQRHNLRPANNSLNQAARMVTKKAGALSKYRGVSFDKRKKKFVAVIRVNYKGHHLGYFSDELQAARAYDSAAVIRYGDFARPNFSPSKASETEKKL